MGGWTCDAPVATGAGSEVACRRDEAMAPGAMARLRLEVDAVRLGGFQDVGVEATVTTLSRDLDPANNADTGRATIVGRPQNPFDR